MAPRVMFLPLNFGDVKQQGVCDAFRQAGCELDVFDYFAIYDHNRKKERIVREKLIQRAQAFKPDLLHLQIQHTSVIDGATIGKIKSNFPRCIVTNWTGDVRNYVPKQFKRIAAFADYNLISSTGQINKFKKEIGKEVRYWQIGVDPKLYHPCVPPRTQFEWDIIFIANNNTKENYPGRGEREHTCKLLRNQFKHRFCLYGNGWPKMLGSKGSLDQKVVAQAYHNSYCLLSVSHYNDLNHYFSDRLLMCMASGRPTISLRFPKWESYFTHMGDIVIAESVEDIPNKVRWLINNPEMAEMIGRSGAEKILAEHTYLSRINELLDMVGLKR